MFYVSCIQITSDNNVFSNLEKVSNLIIDSIKNKADLIVTPENTSLFTLDHGELLEKSEEMNNNFFLESISKISKSYKKWILIGSLPIKLSKKLLEIDLYFLIQMEKLQTIMIKFICLTLSFQNKKNMKNRKNF